MSSVDSGLRAFDRYRQISMEEPNRVLRSRPTHQFKSLGFVCSPSFFSLPTGCRLFSRGVIFTRARVSLALLSLRKNEGLARSLAPAWRLHTNLYKFGQNISSDISYTKYSSDLNLGEGLCICTSFYFPDSGLYLLNGFDFYFDLF